MQQRQFMISKDNANFGPLSFEDILRHLQSGELKWTDHLYDDDTKDWIMALEHPQLTDKFNSGWGRPSAQPIIVHPRDVFRGIEKNHEKEWYVLREGNNYGPYSYLEVIQLLQEKTL